MKELCPVCKPGLLNEAMAAVHLQINPDEPLICSNCKGKNMKDLKDCPFCSDIGKIIINTERDNFDMFKAICWNKKCLIQTPWYPSGKEAQEAWNKRV